MTLYHHDSKSLGLHEVYLFQESDCVIYFKQWAQKHPKNRPKIRIKVLNVYFT